MELEEISLHWTEAPGLRQAKRLIHRRLLRTLMLLRRPEFRALTGLLTGHCPFCYHLHKMGLSNVYRLCKELVETAEHILCYCEPIELKG